MLLHANIEHRTASLIQGHTLPFQQEPERSTLVLQESGCLSWFFPPTPTQLNASVSAWGTSAYFLTPANMGSSFISFQITFTDPQGAMGSRVRLPCSIFGAAAGKLEVNIVINQPVS